MSISKITTAVQPLDTTNKINEIIDNMGVSEGTNVIISDNITSPSGYTQTEYLKCDGNQFIDTGWHFSGTFPIKFDCKFVVDSYMGGTGGYPTVYGLQTSGYSNWIYPFYINGGNFNPYIGGSASIDVVPCSLNTTYDTTFIIDNGTWTRTINGVTTSGTWSGTITQDANMFLGGGSYGTNAINQLFGRICSFRITEGNTVVRDYISHRRNTDGVYGMYDFATSTFKASDSSAPFGGGLSVVGTTIGANLPRYVSQFANDSGYITSSSLSGYQTTANLVNTITSASTSTTYPSALSVYNALQNAGSEIIEYSSGTSGYIIFSGGMCIQWGEANLTNGSVGVALIKSYVDANYCALATAVYVDSVHCVSVNKTSSSFIGLYTDTTPTRGSVTDAPTVKASWITIGQLASGQY